MLIACLLGLGLGMVLDRRPQRLLRLFPIGLAVLVGTVFVLYATDFRLPFISGSEWLWNTSGQATSSVLAYVTLVAFVIAVRDLFRCPSGKRSACPYAASRRSVVTRSTLPGASLG